MINILIGMTLLLASPVLLALTVATPFVTPPLEFHKRHQPVGFEVECIQQIASYLECEVLFIEVKQSELLAALQAGRCDLIMGGLSHTQHLEGIAYTAPLYETAISVLVDRRFSPHLMSPVDLKQARVGVIMGSVEENCAQRLYDVHEIGEIVRYPHESMLTALSDLTLGKTHALFRISPIASYLQFATPSLAIAFELPNEKHALAFGICAERQQLLDQMNQAQSHLMSTTLYQEIERKWLFPRSS